MISFDMLEHCAEALILGDGRKCDPAIWVYNCMGQDDAVGAHLNPIERLWGVLHKWVTHNRHYATFNQFTEAILRFFRKALTENWREFTDTVTANFQIISLDEYKVIWTDQS